jgi:hypothetical protein
MSAGFPHGRFWEREAGRGSGQARARQEPPPLALPVAAAQRSQSRDSSANWFVKLRFSPPQLRPPGVQICGSTTYLL